VHDLLSHHSTAERDNATVIMTIWWTSPQIHSIHQVATGTSSHIPLRRRAIIVAIFHGSGTCGMVPGTVQWGAFLVPILDLLIWRVLQFFRPLEVTISKFRHWHHKKTTALRPVLLEGVTETKTTPASLGYALSVFNKNSTQNSNYAHLQLFFARNAGRRDEHFEGNWSWEKFFESAKSINDGRDILV